MTPDLHYETYEDLVSAIGAQGLDAIRANSKFYTVSTLTGSRSAFRERCSVILGDTSFPVLLKLISATECGHWTMPEHAGTLMRAVRYAVIDQIDVAHTSKRIDLCFEWAAGNFLGTLERCAEVAAKVVSIRRSRDVASAGESIERFLTRLRHDDKIPDPDEIAPFLVSKSTMFRPVVNDQSADWERLQRIGIERHYLFELMTLVTNYACLHNTDKARLLKLVEDELRGDPVGRATSAGA